MNTTKLTSLERTVYGANLINKLTIENLNKVIPQLQPFLNKKIELANGKKAKNFVIDLHTYFNSEEGSSLRSYLHCSYGNLYLKNDVTLKDKEFEGGGYSVNYYGKDIVLGRVENGILIRIDSIEQIVFSYELNKIFDAKEVRETKNKIDALKTELSNLERSIYEFKNIY